LRCHSSYIVRSNNAGKQITTRVSIMSGSEPIGDFYVHLVDGANVAQTLTSSTKLLTSQNVPTVIHFYDGG